MDWIVDRGEVRRLDDLRPYLVQCIFNPFRISIASLSQSQMPDLRVLGELWDLNRLIYQRVIFSC